MNNIIIVGHGKFAEGLESAAKLIIGNIDNLISIEFDKSMSREQLKTKIEAELSVEKNIILTDVLGGTPFNVSAELVTEKTTVVYGSNVGILLEILSNPKVDLNTSELTSTIGVFSISEVN